MITNVIQIGNSRGIRLGTQIIQQCNIEHQVEMKVLENGCILISPIQPHARQNWEKAFEKMHKLNDDKLLIPDVFEDEQL